MPTYAYRAKDRALKVVEGTLEAESEAAAIARLGGLGVYPMTIAEAQVGAQLPVIAGAKRVPNRTVAEMSRQLADLLSGGLSLFSALSLLSQQIEHRLLRRIVSEVAQAVHDGQALSDALAQHPEVFSPFYISLVRTGETGVGLDAVLARLADVAESEAELKSRVTSALVYPLVVLCIGVLTIIVLLTYVVPKLTALFAESGQLLPLPTRVLLAISGSLTHWWWVWGVGLTAGVWAARAIPRSPTGRVLVDRTLLNMPLVGTLVRKLETSRLARNVGVMVGQGVPVLQALEVGSATVGNTILRQAVLHLKDAVQQGTSLAGALTESRQFPVFVSHMVAVGEESGTLDGALLKVASSYERETQRALQALTTVLEPALIVAVGLVVMFIVISMLLPIFELGLVAQ